MKLLIPPPLQGLVCAGLIWAAAMYFPQYSIEIPFKRFFAAVFFITGVIIDLIAIGLFMRTKTTVSPFSPEKTSQLVTSGIYGYTRNPMYLGMALLLTGLTIWFANPFGLLFITLFIWSISTFQIKPEEIILHEKFGEVYGNYCNHVRRWV